MKDEKAPLTKRVNNSKTSRKEDAGEPKNEIIYTELNLEKWSIWEPSSSKKLPRARVIERQRILEDGSYLTAKVEIGFTQHGNLSTRDQKIYYVLFKLWDDAGRPSTPVSFSLQKIARILGEEWSSHAHRTITRSLLQLRNIWFNWENAYFDKSSGEHLEVLDTFNILSELTLARRTRKLHATTEMCVFQFHRQLLENLYANHTTPLFLATVLSFKSEIAQMLYPRLDLLLADKKQYERRTKELFEDLGLEGETYKHRSARKRVIEKALEELRGAPLTTGYIVSATVEPTKDDTDFKIVIHKGGRRQRLTPSKAIAAENQSHQIPDSQMQLAGGRMLSLPLEDDSRREPEEPAEALIVRYFHEKFHGTTLKGALNPKELTGAARLVAQHGFTGAKRLIDFAQVEAPKTGYNPASLNGILQYESRFEIEQDAHVRDVENKRNQQQQQERVAKAQEDRQRELVGELIERVSEVKRSAPQAFTAFLRQVEIERDSFLNTPIARQASASIRELLSKAYEQPNKRLEIFLNFFDVGSEGETLLALNITVSEVVTWIGKHGTAARQALEGQALDKMELGEAASELLI